MGRTVISLIIMQLTILFFLFALGVIDNVVVKFLIGGYGINQALDVIFSSGGGLNIIIQIIAAIFLVIGLAFIAISIIPGVVAPQLVEQAIFIPVIVIEIAINLAMFQVYYAIWTYSHLFAIFTMGIFMLVSCFVILDYWRNPTN